MKINIQKNNASESGMSLVEMLVVVSILGIMAGIGFFATSGVLEGSKSSIARDLQGKLNIALKAHSQSNYEFVLAADDSAYTDELAILRSLQWRDADVPGSPYFKINFNPVGSDDTEDYRLRWNGLNYVLLERGSAGKGLKVDFSGSDQGTNYVFPSGYSPVPGS